MQLKNDALIFSEIADHLIQELEKHNAGLPALGSKVKQKIREEIIGLPLACNTQLEISERLKNNQDKTSYLDKLIGKGAWVDMGYVWHRCEGCCHFSSDGLLKLYWDALYGKNIHMNDYGGLCSAFRVKNPAKEFFHTDFSLRKKPVLLEFCTTLAKWSTPLELHGLMQEFMQGNQAGDMITELCRYRGAFHYKMFGETDSYKTYKNVLLKCAARYQVLARFLEKTPVLRLEDTEHINDIEFVNLDPKWPMLSGDLVKYLAQFIDNRTLHTLSAVCKDLESTGNTFVEKESPGFNRIFNGS